MSNLYLIDNTWHTFAIEQIVEPTGAARFCDRYTAHSLDEAKAKLRADLALRYATLQDELNRVKSCQLALETDSLDIVVRRPSG